MGKTVAKGREALERSHYSVISVAREWSQGQSSGTIRKKNDRACL